LADQRPIVRSEPVIPLETAEFDSDGLLAGKRLMLVPKPRGAFRVYGGRKDLRAPV